ARAPPPPVRRAARDSCRASARAPASALSGRPGRGPAGCHRAAMRGTPPASCDAGADQTGEPLAAARARQNAELHFREAELGPGMIRGHAVPAGEGELEPAAE